MATDRLIFCAPNNRTTTYGLEMVSEALFRTHQRDEDVLDYTADLEAWLGSDTIDDVDYDTQGASAVTGDSFTDTALVFFVSGIGLVDVTVTTDGGRTKKFRLMVENRAENIASSLTDYED